MIFNNYQKCKTLDKEKEYIEGTLLRYTDQINLFNIYAFQSCFSLKTINLLDISYIPSYAFINCIKLNTVTLSNCSYINDYAFSNCYKLSSLYLLGNSICSLKALNAFQSTPLSNYKSQNNNQFGKIYVPSSLYNSYKIASNWSYYSDRFISI